MCFQSLLQFNGEGDCVAAKLRLGNVHNGEGCEELLMPETEREQELGRAVAF